MFPHATTEAASELRLARLQHYVTRMGLRMCSTHNVHVLQMLSAGNL